MSLDEAWPAFVERTFATDDVPPPLQRQASTLSTPTSTTRFASAL